MLKGVLLMTHSCASGKGSPEEYYFNPLQCPLPKAPSMQMYCLYGVGIPTERSYYYLNLESNKVMVVEASSTIPVRNQQGIPTECASTTATSNLHEIVCITDNNTRHSPLVKRAIAGGFAVLLPRLYPVEL